MPKFTCKKVEADAMESASWKFINSCELDGNPSQIFPLLVDGVNWAKWFKGMKECTYTSPQPFKEGTTRTVKFDSGLEVDEYFIIWEENKRFTFRFESISTPVFSWAIEDYILQDLGNNRTRFTYAVYMTPSCIGSLVQCCCVNIKANMSNMFLTGTNDFRDFIASQIQSPMVSDF